MNNERTRATMMLLAGGYIIYIGVTLFQDVWQDRPENFILFVVASIIFIIVGGWVIVSKLKVLSKIREEEMREAQEMSEEQEETEDEVDDSLIEELEEKESSEIVDTDTDAFEREVERMIDENEEHK